MQASRRTIAAATASLLCVLVASLSLAIPLERRFRAEVRASLSAFVARLEESTGLTLGFESVSPSIFKSLRVNGFYAAAPGGRTWLRVRRLVLAFDLDALRRGEYAGLIRGIELRGSEARFDLEDMETLSRIFGGNESGATKLPALPLSFDRLGLELAGEGGLELRASLANFTYRPGGDQAEFGLSAEASGLLPGLGESSLRIKASGRLDRDLGRARAIARFEGELPDLLVPSQRFELAYGDGRVRASRLADGARIDLELGYEPGTGTASASAIVEDFRPSSIVAPRGNLSWLGAWMDGRYGGRFSVRLGLRPRPLAEFRYDLDLAGALPESFLAGGYRFSLAASGDGREIALRSAALEGPLGRLGYEGRFRFADLAPDGLLSGELVLLKDRGPAAFRARLIGADGSYAGVFESLELFGLAPASAALEVRVEGQELALAASAVLPELGGSRPENAPPGYAGEGGGGYLGSLVQAEGRLFASAGAKPTLELLVSAGSLKLATLAPLLDSLLPPRAAPIVYDLVVEGEAYLRTDLERLSYSANELVAASASIPGAFGVLSLSGDLRGLAVRKAELRYAGMELGLSGSLDFAEKDWLAWRLEADFRGLPYALSGTFGGGSLFVQGDYGLRAAFRTSGKDSVFSLAFDELPLPLDLGVVILSGRMDGLFAALGDWSLAVERLAFDPAGASLSGFRLPQAELSGVFGPKGGFARSLAIADGVSALKGSGELAYRLDPGNPSVGFKGELAAGAESYRLDLGYDGGVLSGKAVVKASPLSRFGKLPFSGALNGELDFRFGQGQQRMGYRAELAQGSLNGEPLLLNAEGALSDGVFSISRGRARFRAYELSTVSAAFDLAGSKASLAGEAIIPIGDARLDFGIRLAGRSRAGAASDLLARLLDLELSGSLERLRYRGYSVPSWPISVQLGAEGISVRGGAGGELVASLSRAGELAALTKAPFPLVVEARGKASAKSLDIEASRVAMGIPFFFSLLPPLPFSFPSGGAEGSLSIRGSLSSPELYGSLAATGARVQVPGWLGAVVGPFDTVLLFDGRRISLDIPDAKVGSGRASLKGDITLEGYALGAIRGEVRSLPQAPVPVAARVLGIDFAGSADAGLDFSMAGGVAKLRGALSLLDAKIGISTDTILRRGGPSAGSTLLELDLDVGVGRGVSVSFAPAGVPLIQGGADPQTRLKIRYDQGLGDYRLEGKAVIRGGEAFYISRGFFIKSAEILFNENPDKFDPLVTLRAEARDSLGDESVIIKLEADEARLRDFKPRLSSIPPLSELQIAALLGQSLVGSDQEGEFELRRGLIAVSELIPQLDLTKQFESRVRGLLGLDVLYFRSRIVRQLFFDLSGAEGGAGAAAGTEDVIADYLADTSLYAGLYLGPNIFVWGEAGLRRAEAPLASGLPLTLDSELGIELDTPFGLLQWSVAPTSPLSIRDQRLSLSWRLFL